MINSPYTGYAYHAWYVRSSGDVYYDNFIGVVSSYGIRSPFTNDSSFAWRVHPDGRVDYDYSYYVGGSYGKRSPHTNRTTYAYCVWSSGVIDNSINVNDYSYGSPGTDWNNNAYLADPLGKISNGGIAIYIDDSYGLFYHYSYIHTNCKKGIKFYG